MLDIRYIRNNPDELRHALHRRYQEDNVDVILELDKTIRLLVTEEQNITSLNNKYTKEMGNLIRLLKQEPNNNDNIIRTHELREEIQKNKNQIVHHKEAINQKRKELENILSRIPNILDASVPNGKTEGNNVIIHTNGYIPDMDFAKEHWELGEQKGYFDFDTATKISGSRFVIVKGALARLERAIGQFMLNKQIENGYTEYNVPVLVNEEAMYGTDKLPKFEDQSFKTTDGRWLIPTAEVPLTFMASNTIQPDNFPVRLVALTNCFRSEAGAAGRDTKGILRQHQFQKVEMVSWTKPEDSMSELERMTECAESILNDLKIPYRRVLLCAGDTGFGASKTYDLEVWLPGQKAWREISSCSNTKDFQARRMNARFKRDGKTEYFHTLNGSGLAVGRTLIAVMENYQDMNGNILIPDALKPFMNVDYI